MADAPKHLKAVGSKALSFVWFAGGMALLLGGVGLAMRWMTEGHL